MKELHYLTRQILRYRLERRPDLGEEYALTQNFLKFGAIYVVADPNTTSEEWDGKTFGIATNDRALCLYIDREDALLHAKAIKAVLPNGTIMVMKTTQAMAKSLIDKYSRKGFIDSVWLCGKAPVCARVGVSVFIKDVKRESPSTIMATQPTSTGSANNATAANAIPKTDSPEANSPDGREFVLVDEVRKVLSIASNEARRKLDPGKDYERFHCLLAKLIYANKIDPYDLDQQLGLNSGHTKGQIENLTKDVHKDILIKYLDYFDLTEFLYVFRADCTELDKELKESTLIDEYEIKGANSKTEEVFTLGKIRKAKKDGVNRYQLVLESENGQKTVVVSSKFGFEIGKKYQIKGLESENNTPKGAVTATAPTSLPDKEEIAEALARAEEKQKPKEPARRQVNQARAGKTGGRTRTTEVLSKDQQMEKDRETIIGWICKIRHVGSAEAKNMMAKFYDNPEALASLAKHINTGKYDSSYLRFNYNPKKLANELHYNDILEVYGIMADFDKDPRGTKQRMKYRERDPQYQTKKE